MKIRTHRLLTASLAATLCVAVAACDSKPKHDNGVSVSVKGGTYHFGAMTIQAPAGAVTSTTKLSVSTPHQLAKSSPAPLASFSQAPAIAFDVSLAHGQEPRKPLQMSIPLAGSYLPKGASPSDAVLYTNNGHGGYELVPATVDSKHVLHTQLAHLSPKWLAFLDVGKLVSSIEDTFMPKGIARPRPKDCAKQANVNGIAVQLSGSAWSDEPLSPVHPCLVQNKGKLSLQVINNTYIVWSVATSTNTQFVPTVDNADMEAVKLITAVAYPEQLVKGYLGRQSNVSIALPATSIPASVNLKASPSTTLAELDWIGLNLVMDLVFGKQEVTLDIVRDILDSVSLVNCLQAATQLPNDNSILDAIGHFAETLASTCGKLIAKAVGRQITLDVPAWDRFFERILAVIAASKSGLENLLANVLSILQQFSGVIVVTIRPTTPTCPSQQDFASIASDLYGSPVTTLSKVTCQGSWAVAHVAAGGNATFLLQWQQGSWQLIGTASSYFHANVCSGTPEGIRAVLACG